MKQIIVTTPRQLKEIIAEILTENSEKLSSTSNPPNRENDQKYYSRKETAQQLQITLVTLNKYVKNGIIDCHRVGNRVLFKKDAIEKAIVKRKFDRNGI